MWRIAAVARSWAFIGRTAAMHTRTSLFCPRVRAPNRTESLSEAAKSWARLDAERTLVTLDKLWWRIRDRLDRYIDIAGAETWLQATCRRQKDVGLSLSL